MVFPPMDRRTFATATMAAAAAISGGSAVRAAAPTAWPNIVFIMADDLGYADLSCTGSSHISTPAIDGLARNEALLRQGYSNSSICSPTRTALLTGVTRIASVWDWKSPKSLRISGFPRIGRHWRPSFAPLAIERSWSASGSLARRLIMARFNMAMMNFWDSCRAPATISGTPW